MVIETRRGMVNDLVNHNESRKRAVSGIVEGGVAPLDYPSVAGGGQMRGEQHLWISQARRGGG